jgi:hypothetical protein
MLGQVHLRRRRQGLAGFPLNLHIQRPPEGAHPPRAEELLPLAFTFSEAAEAGVKGLCLPRIL